jgi:predicted AAA+ superfamily ATPase
MRIPRETHLQQLIERRFNGLVNVLTAMRRSGKSYLLFQIYRDYLVEDGIQTENTIEVALDDDVHEDLRDPKQLSSYTRSRISDPQQQYYVFLDEAQYAITQEETRDRDRPIRLYGMLNGLLRLGNVNVYVTGSNSKSLSSDIMTEFRGRSDTIHVNPLSFAEYHAVAGLDTTQAYEEYARFGGMPYLVFLKNDEQKTRYLGNLFSEVYFKDILERHIIGRPLILSQLTDALCSSIGSLTNANKLARSISDSGSTTVSSETIASYLGHLSDSFLFKEAKGYDVKGKRYFHYPSKYFCTAIGLRNARLSFRQQDEGHIMENIIFNELVGREYLVDVGVVEVTESNEKGKQQQKQIEVDFVINKGPQKLYIQSTLSMESEEKKRQELKPLYTIKDNFKKIFITKTHAKPWTDDDGDSSCRSLSIPVGSQHTQLKDFLTQILSRA